MIRIEGIPVVASRLAQSGKGKAVRARKKNDRTSKVTNGKTPATVSSLSESKVA